MGREVHRNIVLLDPVPRRDYHIVELAGSGIRLRCRIDTEMPVGAKLMVRIDEIDAESMHHSVSSSPWGSSGR